MNLEPFCGWGDGPDVGINLTIPYNLIRMAADSNTVLICIDLTSTEALNLASSIFDCAWTARRLDREMEQYYEEFALSEKA